MTVASSFRQNIGQLFVGGFSGAEVPDDFARLARDGKLGGAILFRRNLEKDLLSVRNLTNDIHALNPNEPLLISIDQEGGRVQRLCSPFPELPPMRVIGEARSKEWARIAGEVLGHGLRVLGFDQNYAPVLDVDSNPDNPVIGDRAFSSEVQVVCDLAREFIQGLQSKRVAACGKHFPGHGDTELDSHKQLPCIHHGQQRLDRVELPPFKAASEVGVASIMSAHVVYTSIDAERPATLSPLVMRPILREYLGFQGVIVSDDLEMKAITNHQSVPEAAVQALKAGCDQLLICHQPNVLEEAVFAVEKAVADGVLSEFLLEQSINRIRALKRKYVVRDETPAKLEEMVVLQEYSSAMSEIRLAYSENQAMSDPTEPVS